MEMRRPPVWHPDGCFLFMILSLVLAPLAGLIAGGLLAALFR